MASTSVKNQCDKCGKDFLARAESVCNECSGKSGAESGHKYRRESEKVMRAYDCGTEMGHCAYIAYLESELEKFRAPYGKAVCSVCNGKGYSTHKVAPIVVHGEIVDTVDIPCSRCHPVKL